MKKLVLVSSLFSISLFAKPAHEILGEKIDLIAEKLNKLNLDQCINQEPSHVKLERKLNMIIDKLNLLEQANLETAANEEDQDELSSQATQEIKAEILEKLKQLGYVTNPTEQQEPEEIIVIGQPGEESGIEQETEK